MSEVHRYGMIATVGDYYGRPHAYIDEIADEQGDWVHFEDYERVSERCERLVGLLQEANALLIHMQAFYAPDLVGGEQVCKSQEFMDSNGGTLWQLATMFDRIQKELGHGDG